MFNQLRKSGSISLINVVIAVMVMVLIGIAVTGFYQRASAGNTDNKQAEVVPMSCCGGDNNSECSMNKNNKNNNGTYGQTLSNNSVLTVKDLEKNKNKYLGKTVKIEGTITKVCQSMGCWFYVNDTTGTIYVDLGMNGNFTIPKDSAKSHVIVEGILQEADGELSIKGQGATISK